MKLLILGSCILISFNSQAMYVARSIVSRTRPLTNTYRVRFNTKKMSTLTALQALYVHAREERLKYEKVAGQCAKDSFSKCDLSCFPSQDCRDALNKARAEEERAYNVLHENRQVLWAQYKSVINLDEHESKALSEKKKK